MSEKTTPSFGPMDDLDLDMPNWTADDDIVPFPSLDIENLERGGMTVPTGGAELAEEYAGRKIISMITDSPDTTTASQNTWPISPRLSASPPPMKRPMMGDDDEPLITQIRRAGTDGSTTSWRVVSPIVKVEDYESSEMNLTMSIESSSTDTANMNLTRNGHEAPTLQVEGRPRSHSDVGVRAIQRNEDGTWGGLSPEMRRGQVTEGLGLGIGQGADFLPMNLREMEQFKKMQEKNLEVEEWLRRSPILGPRTRVKTGNSENRGLGVPKTDRRSKSISDFRFSGVREPRQESGVNGDIDNDTDSDDVVSQIDSSWEEGSLDAWADNPEKPDKITSPVANPERMDVDAEEEEYDPNKDPKLLPRPNQFYSAKPWRDDPTFGPTPRGIANPNQPHTSNAAIHRFKEANDRLETASRVATFGSARNTRNITSSDVDKFVNTEGILKRLSFGRDKDKDKEKSPKDRKSSIFEFPFKGIKRTPSNAGDGGPPKPPLAEHLRKDSTSSSAFPPPRWRPTWSNQRRGKLSIDTAIGAMTGQLAAVGAAHGESGGRSTTSGGTSPLPWSALVGTNSLGPPAIGIGMKRSRSKSDLSSLGSSIGAKLTKPRPTPKPEFGLATMMHLHGGPPAIPLTSSPTVFRRHTFGSSTTSIPNLGSVAIAMATAPGLGNTLQEEAAGLYDSDDDDEAEIPIAKPLKKLDIKPTFEGYATNIRELNPLLAQKLVDRIAHEQVKRYKKLQDNKVKHSAAVARGDCHNKSKCLTLNPRGTPESFTKISAANASNGSEEHLDNTIIGAQYPLGVPDPPITRLPAEFECTICFKVKRFGKPSDWTKHVHEDVQPFTCTFPDCTEPKSFKRKADWVRHENERHRHLEWWKCNQTDCQHICYRKDNFVQHLVREHKFPEPKVKAAKAAMKAKAGAKGKKAAASAVAVDPVKEQADKVLAIVELCHNDTKKEPTSEQCRFCGQTCTTWKKLTVHLARHMEQISLPILDLIKDEIKPTSPEEPLSPPIAGSPKPTHSVTAAGGQVKATACGDIAPDQLYSRQHHAVHPQAPPVSPNAANTLSPSTPIGGAGYYHNQPLLSTINASIPTLTASPKHMSIAGNFAYEVDDCHSHHGSFQEQSFLEHPQCLEQEMQHAQQHQQGEQKLGGNTGGRTYYPSPSGSVSPYLMPTHQTSPHLIHHQQRRVGGTQTPPMLGVGMMDPGRFAGTTPGTTPPRSNHSMRQFNLQGPQQQHQQMTLEGLGAGLNSVINGNLNVNMSMLNMSLPTTGVSMEQLQFTSAPTAPSGLGPSVGIGAGSVGLGLEQLSIDALERQLLSRDTGGGADQGLYGGPGPTIRTYQSPGDGMGRRGAGIGPRLEAFPMGGIDMTEVQVSANDEASWAWGGGGGYGAQQ